METKEKILHKIKKSQKRIILRCEFDDLGGRTQVTEAIKNLVTTGYLDRIGKGVYEKTTHASSNASNEYILLLVESVFKELGEPLCKAELEKRDNDRVCVVYTKNMRISRKLTLHGVPVCYAHSKPLESHHKIEEWKLPVDVDELPKSDVRNYIERFAEHYKIKYQRTGLDEFAEAVTRMAGDDIKLDATEKLLVVLKKNELINAKQLARLLSNYLKEVSNVRPIRRLRDPWLSA
ncbi:hypothetical protein PS914_05045 [Pseudomonas fluorescens]|uniref:hypothetical protein n=1 Tax=Pseudomonas fluorescens TaxID=294 RepID=UPI001241E2A2|nr:hypothetical protein [Pseudomonas fluorescens]VVQ09911.1 hypothetical protein PS914_05045 [Pseudomonas fluorescens]